jgi:putative colanic acid biosynthesis acetyltransferase WcaF
MSTEAESPKPLVALEKSVASWSFGTKVRRLLWETTVVLLWPRYFRFLSPVRVLLLKLFGARIHGPVLVMDRVRVWIPWHLQLDAYSTLGSGVEIYNFGRVKIGTHSVVSQRAFVCTASHEYKSRSMTLFWKDIVIEDSCWVGAEAFLGPGVVIGRGAIVGARAVVTKNVAALNVVAGNPARFIKMREFHDIGSDTDA